LINVKDLMQLHVEALFTRDAAGRLVAVNEPGGAAAPRFFLGRTADGNAWWFRHDVDAILVNDLAALCESQPTALEVEAVPGIADPFIISLAREQPVRRTWAGPAFRFPSDLLGSEIAVAVTPDNATLLSPYLEDWRKDVSEGVPMAVVLEDGRAVSLCSSVRVTPRAHEAGVETHRDFRGRGHAARAVAVWARAVSEMGRTPLYSTSWENEASLALAKKLGLPQYGVDLHIT
jgi:RimJ/RimL family protein N-acetyltransferase